MTENKTVNLKTKDLEVLEGALPKLNGEELRSVLREADVSAGKPMEAMTVMEEALKPP